MKKNNRSVVNFIGVAIAALLLSACNGETGGSGVPAVVAPPAPPPASSAGINISGTAVKGIIRNGIVTIYGVTNGVQDTESLIEGTTDAVGEYSLEIPGDYSGPIVIEITAGPSTVMACDVVAGCGGGVAFGGDVPLAEGELELKAVVPAVAEGETVSTNVSTLTSMAAELAITEGIDATSAGEANSQVANLFGITGDLTELEVVDITDTAALAAASPDAQQAALVSAAILAEGLESGASIRDTLDSVVASFADNGGQLISNETTGSSAITLAEIFTQVETIVTDSFFDTVDLGVLETKAKVLLATAEAAPADTLTTVEPSTPEEATTVAAARALIANIRTVGLASTFEDTAVAADSFVTTMEASMALISEDTELAADATGQAIEAIFRKMIVVAFPDEEEGPLDDIYDYELMYEIEDILYEEMSCIEGEGEGEGEECVFAEVGEGDVYTVNADISIGDWVHNEELDSYEYIVQGVVAVDISMTGSIAIVSDGDEDGGETESGGFAEYYYMDNSLNLNISSLSGTAVVAPSEEASGVSLTINSASKIMISGGNTYEQEFEVEFLEEGPPIESYSEHDDTTLSMVDIVLDVELTEMTGASPLMFEGELSFSGSGIIFTDSFTGEGGLYPPESEGDCFPATNVEYASLVASIQSNPEGANFDPEGAMFCGTADSLTEYTESFTEISLGLNGTFSQGGTSFSAIVMADLMMPEGLTFSDSDTETQTFLYFPESEEAPFDIQIYVPGDETGETEQLYVGGNVSLALEFSLPGVDPSTSLSMSATRTGLDSLAGTVVLAFNNERLSAAVEADETVLAVTITDQNGNTLSISETEATEESYVIAGDVKVDNEVIGTVSEENGVIIVRYIDGSFESLL